MTVLAIVRATFVAVGLVSSLEAQVKPPSSALQVSATATPRSAASRDALPVDLQPHRIIYGHVLRQIADFGHRAEALEAQGKDPGIFRDLLPKQTGVTPSVASYITQLAYQYEQEMAVNQARVKQAVTAFRQAHKGGIDAGNPPPIPDPELQALYIERTKITEDYVARLQALLGEEAFERFDDKVRTNIVSGPRYGLDSATPEPAE